MYYVYVLKNKDGDIYIGYTSDLKQRLKNHNSGRNVSTRGHKWQLVYYEAYLSKQDAYKREQNLKKHGQAKRWLKERIQNSLGKNS